MNEFDDAQITMVYDPENGETIAQGITMRERQNRLKNWSPPLRWTA